ncbi:hypothetical protein [Natronorubrum tibetense]|uniref:Uncharacterized protein n=1 Tax=Natronorubrum tibetense GA33 TaxID=1114856 RepID=L9WA26_9EURY|nr:hypothetical protein [Natronorubrum tibetense]ELY46111.1 hypothetical protein C496_01051 [Natronorubrum tibetense GA33]
MRSTKCRYSETVADGDVRIRPVVGPQSPPEHYGDAEQRPCDAGRGSQQVDRDAAVEPTGPESGDERPATAVFVCVVVAVVARLVRAVQADGTSGSVSYP